jgi:transcriptional regulator with XRE-family HTH domain
MPGSPPRFSGAKLKNLREERDLSQQALCALVRSDLSLVTLRRWEQDVNPPSYDDACRLAAALGVGPGYFAEMTR